MRLLAENKFLKYFISGIFFLFFTSFSFKEEPLSTYALFEKKIRDKYDHIAVFTWAQYCSFLDKLKEDKFVVLPLNEMRKREDRSKVVVGLRHDVDLNPCKALEMARLEHDYDIRSTYFFLATAEYYGQIENEKLVRSPIIKDILIEVHKTGSEIGIHNDLLSVMIVDKLDPYEFNKEELKYYKSLRIPVYGTAAHGSRWGKQINISGYEIFSDYAQRDSIAFKESKYPLGLHSLRDYGFKYEAYKIPFDKYFSDSGGKWSDKEGLDGILKRLDECKPGERVEILVHPDWWGKKE